MPQDFASFLSGLTASDQQSDTSLMSGKEFERQGTEILKAKDKAMEPFRAESAKLTEQISGLAGKLDAIKAPKAPGLKELPQMPDSQFQNPMQALGGVTSLLAIIGSFATRRPAIAALNAGAAAMQGFHKGDQERIKLEREKAQDELHRALKQNEQELRAYNQAMQEANFDMSKAEAGMRVVAAQHQDVNMRAALEAGNWDSAYQLLQQRASLTEKAAEFRMRMKEMKEARKDRQAAAAQAHADRMAMQTIMVGGGPGGPLAQSSGNADQILSKLPPMVRAGVEGIANYTINPNQFSNRGNIRGQMVELAKMVNPNYDANQFTVRSGVMRDFASGQTSKNITSMNTAFAHLGTLVEMGDALNNGDVKRVNELANLLSTEIEGHPEVNNFQTATQAVGDELGRTFRVVGASETENAAWQSRFSPGASPDIIRGGAKTAGKLLLGRLSQVNDQWKRGMGTDKNFPNLIGATGLQVMKELDLKNPLGEDKPATSGGVYSDPDKEARYQAWKKDNGF